jgi:hypothetical protein
MMIPTFLDLRTGKTAKGCEASHYWWTEGNGSCDCSRAIAFDLHAEDLGLKEGVCFGCRRFIAIDVEGDLRSYDYEGNDPQPNTKEQVLAAMNSEYANILERRG